MNSVDKTDFTWIRELTDLNLAAVLDIALDLRDAGQLTSTPTLQAVPNIVRFSILMPADGAGMRDRYLELRGSALEYLEAKGIVTGWHPVRDPYVHRWQSKVQVNVDQTVLSPVVHALQAEYGTRLKAMNSKMPERDSTTGLLPRAALDTAILDCLGNASETEPLSVVMMDVDKFKSINDTHGHAVGDKVLAEVAHRVSTATKGKGDVYRYGGEEFTLLLPNYSTEEATAVAERLRLAIAAQPVAGIPVTVSFGVSSYPGLSADRDSLMGDADKALYDAKNLGRNLVRVFNEAKPERGPRSPDRKTATADGLTEGEGEKIRNDYFVRRIARCPRDGAVLSVHESQELGVARRRLYVTCGMCGLSAQV